MASLDPRLWAAFFVHDIGYLGKPNMDGPEGEMHPIPWARIMGWLFDWPRLTSADRCHSDGEFIYRARNKRWYNFSLLHSRYYAKKLGLPFSRLCVADKLAIALTSW